jgi:transposase
MMGPGTTAGGDYSFAICITRSQVGTDIAITSSATANAGEHIANPRRDRAAATRYRKIANQRKDFHHNQASKFVQRYDLLVLEDPQITNMPRQAANPREKPAASSCRRRHLLERRAPPRT